MDDVPGNHDRRVHRRYQAQKGAFVSLRAPSRKLWQILDISPCTFGSTGIFAVPGFSRFYRHVLIQKRFPHHVAVGFSRVGGVLFDVLQYLGLDDINTPLPAGFLYQGENIFFKN